MKPSIAYICEDRHCEEAGTPTPKAWGVKGNDQILCRTCGSAMTKTRLSDDQKRAIEAYEFALREEDRYLGSVFVNRIGQERIEAKTKAAHDRAERLGVGRWC
jgi:hypothetical protein